MHIAILCSKNVYQLLDFHQECTRICLSLKHSFFFTFSCSLPHPSLFVVMRRDWLENAWILKKSSGSRGLEGSERGDNWQRRDGRRWDPEYMSRSIQDLFFNPETFLQLLFLLLLLFFSPFWLVIPFTLGLEPKDDIQNI